MLKTATRGFLTILLVGVLAGSAVAFAVGGGFSSKKTVCIHPIPGSSYQICVQTPPIALKPVQLAGLNLGKIKRGHLNLKFTNTNKVPVKVKVLLLIKTKPTKVRHRTKSGKIRTTTKPGKIVRITRTFQLGPGEAFNVNRALNGLKVAAAKLTVTITDANGDHKTITRTVGKFS